MFPAILSWLSVLLFLLGTGPGATRCRGDDVMEATREERITNLARHLQVLTVDIGERSFSKPWKLEETAAYIEEHYRSIGVRSSRQNYSSGKAQFANIVAEVSGRPAAPEVYLIGAHYDCVAGTVGADDNASAIAVQLEIARELARYDRLGRLGPAVLFVSFALEEPPAYNTLAMGSKVYASRAKKRGDRIDGMICLEMVGYTCHRPGCQEYPFPLMFFGYPEVGDFIGIVGNFRSRSFTASLHQSFKHQGLLPAIKLTVPWSGYLLPSVRLSDHASFWDKGYRAVMITDTAFYRNPNYHTRRDTMKTLDLPFMAALVESLSGFFVEAEGK